MSIEITDEMVEAAQAWGKGFCVTMKCVADEVCPCRDTARVILSAAAPLIEAAVSGVQ